MGGLLAVSWLLEMSLRSFAFVTESCGSHGFELTAHRADEEEAPFCLRSNLISCRRVDQGHNNIYDMSDAGAWSSPPSHALVGLRRNSKQANGVNGTDQRSSRHRRRGSSKPGQQDGEDTWQAYKFGVDGEIETTDVPLPSSESSGATPLYVNKAGPITALDAQTVAVAFGNTVKIIRTSRRGTISNRSAGQPLERLGSTSRRRLTLRKGQ